MIRMTKPLAAGNAIRLFLDPPAGAVSWRVLKKATNDFALPEDDYALVAYEGDLKVVVDAESLQNEVAVFYCPFYRDRNGVWTKGNSVAATPVASYEDASTDVQSFVRERLAAGLLEECRRGTFATDAGYIQVFTGPPIYDETLRLPVVTVHLDTEHPAERGIGEDLCGDDFDDFDSEGWLADVGLSIVAWSLNSDERIELRKAIRRIVLANLPVFDAYGMIHIGLSAQDFDAVSGEYGAPIYQVLANFSCQAPTRVRSKVSRITDVDVSVAD